MKTKGFIYTLNAGIIIGSLLIGVAIAGKMTMRMR